MSENGLIAFDLDGTFCRAKTCTGKRTCEAVPANIPLVVEFLRNQFVVAVCSGNAAAHVIKSLVRELFKALYEAGELELASRFHCFYQLGGGLASFDLESLRKLQRKSNWQSVARQLFTRDGKNFHEQFVDASYVRLQSIDVNKHADLLESIQTKAMEQTRRLMESAASDYVRTSLPEGEISFQHREIRIQVAGGNTESKIVQLTLKPLPSEFHLRSSKRSKVEPAETIRGQVTTAINAVLNKADVKMAAIAGGRTSIDIVNADLSKATAIRYLLKLYHEHPQNLMYLGDEFYVGGNDLVVPTDLEVESFTAGERAVLHPHVHAAPSRGPRGVHGLLYTLLGFTASHHSRESAVAAFCKQQHRKVISEKLRDGDFPLPVLAALSLILTAESRKSHTANSSRLLRDSLAGRYDSELASGMSHWESEETIDR